MCKTGRSIEEEQLLQIGSKNVTNYGLGTLKRDDMRDVMHAKQRGARRGLRPDFNGDRTHERMPRDDHLPPRKASARDTLIRIGTVVEGPIGAASRPTSSLRAGEADAGQHDVRIGNLDQREFQLIVEETGARLGYDIETVLAAEVAHDEDCSPGCETPAIAGILPAAPHSSSIKTAEIDGPRRREPEGRWRPYVEGTIKGRKGMGRCGPTLVERIGVALVRVVWLLYRRARLALRRTARSVAGQVGVEVAVIEGSGATFMIPISRRASIAEKVRASAPTARINSSFRAADSERQCISLVDFGALVYPWITEGCAAMRTAEVNCWQQRANAPPDKKVSGLSTDSQNDSIISIALSFGVHKEDNGAPRPEFQAGQKISPFPSAAMSPANRRSGRSRDRCDLFIV